MPCSQVSSGRVGSHRGEWCILQGGQVGEQPVGGGGGKFF